MNIQEGSIIPTSKMQISLSRVQILFDGSILRSSTRIELKKQNGF